MPFLSWPALKKISPRDEFSSSGFFLLRTPLLPLDELLQFTATAARAPSDDVAAGQARARAYLRQWAARPEIREALTIASPEFVQSLDTQGQPDSVKGRRLDQALYRYLARMTARATPFGAFAGCSTGEIADITRLELAPRSRYRLHTRLDMELLCWLAEKLAADPEQRRNLRFRANASLHLVAEKYHHVQLGEREGVHLVQLIASDPTPALDATLSRAAGSATAGDLASALLASDPEITQEQADLFIERLIDSQLLVSELAPPVTGPEPILYMAEQLEKAQAAGVAGELRALAADLKRLDRSSLGSDLRRYDGIAGSVSALGVEFKAGHLLQVDMIKPPVALALERRLIGDIVDAIQALHSIHQNISPPALEQFKEHFHDRYQDREIPVLEALDDEAGIGFEQEDNPTAEPLISGIDFRGAEPAPAAPEKDVPPLLARRLEELRAKGELILQLDAGLLGELKVDHPLPLPDAFTAMGAAFMEPDGETGFYLQSTFGPSGANLLARFGRADERLGECVQTHVHAEEAVHAGDAVFAEIVHLPEGRVGNVVCRPVLRRYEIPLRATPGVPADRQIAISDLTVSVRNGRIVLRSRRLGVEVIPRLTSAHNFANPRSWKLYKFLCLLQHQGTCPDLFFDWGAAGKASFLPRVTLGKVVVSLACWRINNETALELTQGRTSVSDWRRANHVPRFAFIAELDHQLLIDFENPLAVETFLDLIRKQPETVMMEMFPGPEALAVRGPEGRFVHEMILPFVRRERRPVAAPPPDASSASSSVRRGQQAEVMAGKNGESFQLEPGSEWLFAKLYCSPSHADRLLLEFIQPLVAEIMEAQVADRWFFVRYGDPGWHLRLRIHGDPAALGEHILPVLTRRAQPFRRNGVLWRMHFDRYEREVERYGGPQSIAIAERLFQFDSELALDLLPLVLSDAGAELRWRLALCAADRLLAGLGFSTTERKTLAQQMRAAREESWIVDETYRRQLAGRFRSISSSVSIQGRQELAAMLAGLENNTQSGSQEGALPPEAVSAFHRFSGRLQTLREQWLDLQQRGELTATLPEIAGSLVHMQLNRLLRSCHLEQETVICDFLIRTYATKLARGEPD